MEVKFLSSLKYYDKPTDQPTNRPTDRRTDRVIGKFHFHAPIVTLVIICCTYKNVYYVNIQTDMS